MSSAGYLCEEKVDGWRALWLRDHEGRPGLYTRNGMPIMGAGHITYWLLEMEKAAGEALFIDGEFQVGATLDATKRWCERGWKGGGEAGRMFLFDVVPWSEWRRGGTDRPLVERKAMLVDLTSAAADDGWEWRPGSHGRDEAEHPVQVLEDVWLGEAQDIASEANRVWATGGEGLMLKDMEAGYSRSRNASWLKVKQGQ